MAALLAFAAGCGKRATAHSGLFLVVIVIRFALGGSVDLLARTGRGFPRLARNGCSLVSAATSHWFSWLRIELHFRAAAARHVKAQMMPASPPRSLCRLSPRVAMVKAAQARQRNQTGIRRWPWLDRASIGRVFVQRVVNAILLVIAHVVADQTAKVFFVHWDDMVEDLTAAAANPSFGGSVLPWRLNARSFWLKSGGLQERNHIDVEDRIVIQNGVAIGSRLWKGFSQLLHDPIGRWMRRNVEVENPAALVLDDEETVQHSKSGSRHGEEVEGDDGLAMVAKKRKPFLGRITAALEAPQITRDGPFGEHEAELLQLAMDLRRTPVGVLLREAPY